MSLRVAACLAALTWGADERPDVVRLHAAHHSIGSLLSTTVALHLRWRVKAGRIDQYVWQDGDRVEYRVAEKVEPAQPTVTVEYRDGAVRVRDALGGVGIGGASGLASARTRHAVLTDAWASGDFPLQTERQAGGGARVSLTSPNGSAASLILDGDGNVTHSSIAHDGFETDETDYSDFRACGARVKGQDGGVEAPAIEVVVPHRMSIPGPHGYPATLARCELVPLNSLKPLGAGPEWTWADGVRRLDFPIATGEERIRLPVTIGGRRAIMALDTGTQTTIIDRTFAASIGMTSLPGVAQQVADSTLPVAEMPRLDLGSASLEPHFVLVGPLGTGAMAQEWSGVDGILGVDILSGVLLTIDYPAGRLWLAPGSATPAPEGTLVTTRNDGPWLSIPARVGGAEKQLLLDTGGLGPTFLELDHCNKQLTVCHGARPMPRGSLVGWGIDGFEVAAVQRDLRVASFASPHATVALLEHPANAHVDRFLPDGMDGALGVGFLSHFKVTIDYSAHKVWLRQARAFGANEENCGHGFWPFRAGASLRATRVWGLAARAGLRDGDEIVSINGLDSGALASDNALPACVPGQPLELALLRNGKRLQLRWKDESLFPAGK